MQLKPEVRIVAQRVLGEEGVDLSKVVLGHSGDTTDLEIAVGVSQVLILVAFMFSFVLAMTAAFLGAPSIAADLESGVAHAMLARPIRRADLLIGRWLGLAAVIAAYAAASGLLEVAAVRFVSGYAPPQPMLAVGFLTAQGVEPWTGPDSIPLWLPRPDGWLRISRRLRGGSPLGSCTCDERGRCVPARR